MGNFRRLARSEFLAGDAADEPTHPPRKSSGAPAAAKPLVDRMVSRAIGLCHITRCTLDCMLYHIIGS